MYYIVSTIAAVLKGIPGLSRLGVIRVRISITPTKVDLKRFDAAILCRLTVIFVSSCVVTVVWKGCWLIMGPCSQEECLVVRGRSYCIVSVVIYSQIVKILKLGTRSVDTLMFKKCGTE